MQIHGRGWLATDLVVGLFVSSVNRRSKMKIIMKI